MPPALPPPKKKKKKKNSTVVLQFDERIFINILKNQPSNVRNVNS